MPEPVTTTTVAAIKAGAFASLITLFASDMNMMMVFITGSTGGVAFFFKELAHLDKETRSKTTTFKIFSEFFHMIPMSIATAGVVIYTGTESLNKYLNAGDFVWWFFGLMAALNYNHVVRFFVSIVKKLIYFAVDRISKRIGDGK